MQRQAFLLVKFGKKRLICGFYRYSYRVELSAVNWARSYRPLHGLAISVGGG
jgi:hypothetical protein